MKHMNFGEYILLPIKSTFQNSESGQVKQKCKNIYSYTGLSLKCQLLSCLGRRAGCRAVDLGEQAFIRGRPGQSLKLSTKAALFKRVNLLIEEAWPPFGAGPAGPYIAPQVR